MQSHWDVGPGCSGSYGKASFGSGILRGGVGGVGKGQFR